MESTAARCAVFRSQFTQRLEDQQRQTREEAVKLATRAFWEEQEGSPLWVVPMGDDSIFARHCGLLTALDRARDAGRTPLLVDNSQDRVVDTFFSYQRSQVLEAKKMLVDERQGKTRTAVLEHARKQLVKTLRLGQTFYIRLANSACDFVGKYSGPDTIPMALFDVEQVAALNSQFGSEYGSATQEVGANLWGADDRSPFAAVLREEDTDKGVFVPQRGFEVVVCTHLGVEDYEEFLDGKLPMEQLQPIAVIPQHGGEGAESRGGCQHGVSELLSEVQSHKHKHEHKHQHQHGVSELLSDVQSHKHKHDGAYLLAVPTYFYFTSWLAGWLAGWLADWPAGWLAGWLAG